jgi:DNA-binding XRE family transcriptional regulator
MTPEARSAAEADSSRLADEMNLAELRRTLRISQEELAKTQVINPPEKPEG